MMAEKLSGATHYGRNLDGTLQIIFLIEAHNKKKRAMCQLESCTTL